MSGLRKEEMLRYFEEINEQLKSEHKHGEILIVGGAALTLVFNARESTHDIDAMFEPKEDMRKIIKNIAQKYDIAADWLNDGAKGFMTDKMTYSTYLEYSHLRISNVDAEGLLAMKLSSARPKPSSDMQDSIFLMKVLEIKDETQLFEIIEKYVYPTRQTMQVKYFTDEAFSQYQKQHLIVSDGN